MKTLLFIIAMIGLMFVWLYYDPQSFGKTMELLENHGFGSSSQNLIVEAGKDIVPNSLGDGYSSKNFIKITCKEDDLKIEEIIINNTPLEIEERELKMGDQVSYGCINVPIKVKIRTNHGVSVYEFDGKYSR